MITVHFDGAAILDVKAAFGFVVEKHGKVFHTDCGIVESERATCNVAEHYALFAALSFLYEGGFKDETILVKGDSNMVIQQIFGRWRGKHKKAPYFPIMQATKKLMPHFTSISGMWIPREKNIWADSLSKEGLLKQINPKHPKVERLPQPVVSQGVLF